MKRSLLARILCFSRLAVLLLSTGSASVFADALRIIELTDGSSISGRVVALEDGVYTIESETLGSLYLPQSEVVSIRSPQAVRREFHGVAPGFDPEALQNRILQDPEIMTDIMSLQQDRQIQAILSDPGILRSLQAGDISALTEDPRIIELLKHPRIKLIQDKILGR